MSQCDACTGCFAATNGLAFHHIRNTSGARLRGSCDVDRRKLQLDCPCCCYCNESGRADPVELVLLATDSNGGAPASNTATGESRDSSAASRTVDAPPCGRRCVEEST